MKKYCLPILIALFCVLLCACGQSAPEAPAPTVEVTPFPTPAPTPEPTPEPPVFILGQEVSREEVGQSYSFELFGQELNTASTETLLYKQVSIGDEGLEQFREVLPYMSALKYLCFDRCDTSDEAVAALRDEFPDVKIVWRVYCPPYSFLTDYEVLWISVGLNDENVKALQYCRDVRYLDLGHNAIHDVSFVENMPNLEVLILSCGEIVDISPLACCTNLEYLELAECRITDISPLAGLTQLEHLNIGGNQGISDFEPLKNLTNLKRLYAECIYNTEINMTDLENEFKALMPDTEVDFQWYADGALNGGKWKYSLGAYNGKFVDRYQLLREQFNYNGLDDGKPYIQLIDVVDENYGYIKN